MNKDEKTIWEMGRNAKKIKTVRRISELGRDFGIL